MQSPWVIYGFPCYHFPPILRPAALEAWLSLKDVPGLRQPKPATVILVAPIKSWASRTPLPWVRPKGLRESADEHKSPSDSTWRPVATNHKVGTRLSQRIGIRKGEKGDNVQ